MITTLQNKPAIGIISGFSSAAFSVLKDFLTDDGVLKMVSICGIWLGFIVAILTGIVKIFEILEKVRAKR